ncbi:glycosyltransferase [Candidatus Cyanaurora vandensis]|uniref:glycosyltransferase n=1 Tax=Candidatus Cyanaurora vandensis TaxID=2714958 RepID=UPI00257FC433|nr:glycosyltransferase [Candidatus Cyanaurora vandensis]
MRTTTAKPRLVRPRLAMLHPSCGLNWSGGAEVYTLELARQLNRYFEVELFCGAMVEPFCRPVASLSRAHRSPWREKLLTPLLKTFSRNPSGLVEHATAFFPALGGLLRSRADLIFPNNDYGGLAVAAVVRAVQGVPVLFTEHAGLAAGGKPLRRNLSFKPDHLVVFNEQMAQVVRDHRPEQPVSVIHNGVDLQRFQPEGERFPLPAQGPVILCVARLSCNSHKRPELLIRACAKLNVHLWLVGEGADRDYFLDLGRKLLGERFTLASYPYDQMPAVYRRADVFTLPSVDEPCALSYLEAQACNRPVVTTDDPNRRRTLAGGAVFCDVTDPASYAQAIQEALATPWQDRPRQNAQRFGWDQMALHYRDLIQQLLAR